MKRNGEKKEKEKEREGDQRIKDGHGWMLMLPLAIFKRRRIQSVAK